MSDDGLCCTWITTALDFIYPRSPSEPDGISLAPYYPPRMLAPGEHTHSILPFELLDIIFDFVRQYDRTKETLLACSLVCKVWRWTTLRHRFHSLTIRQFSGTTGYTEMSDFVSVLAFLRSREDVRTAVRRLKLTWRNRQAGALSSRLVELFLTLPRLKTLEFKGAPSSLILPRRPEIFERTLCISELIMDKFYPGLTDFVYKTAAAATLKRLEIGFVGERDVPHITEFFRSATARIEHLVYGLNISFPANEGYLDLSALHSLKTLSITITSTTLRTPIEQSAVLRAAHSVASLDVPSPLKLLSFRIATVSHANLCLEERITSAVECIAPVVEAITSLFEAGHVEKVCVGLYDIPTKGRFLDPEGYVPSESAFRKLFSSLSQAGILEVL